MIFVETSVLVASCQDFNTRHADSFALVASLSPGEACTSVHSVTEMFSVMTRLPPRFRIPPTAALHLVEQTRRIFSVVALDASESFQVMQDFVALGLGGGMIYDAMILGCARKAKATAIYTLNKKHFDIVAPDLASRIREP